MQYASDNEIYAFHSGSQKQLSLTFSDGTVIGNDDIASESMSFEQSICEEESLKFGQVSSSCFRVQLLGVSKKYKDLTVEPTISATYDDGTTTTTFTRPLGVFKVYSDKATDNKLARDLECYDSLYEVLQTDYSDWYNSLTFPITVKNYRDAFFNHVGITQESIELINDDMEINKNFVAENYSGADLLSDLCVLNACFGHISFNGNFRYVVIEPDIEGLYPSEELYPDDELYPKNPDASVLRGGSYISGSLKYEEFETKAISRLQVRMTQDDIGVVVGSEGNDYVIEDNPLLYGKTSSELIPIATNIFNIIRLVYYTPATVKTPCNPWSELGDVFKVVSINGESIILCMLHRKIEGITALFDTYTCNGTEYYEERANGVNRNLLVLKQYTNELTRTIEETQSTITELESTLDGDVTRLQSQITQNAESITAEVTRATNTEETLSSSITQTAESISSEVQRASSAESALSTKITQTAESISLDVTNGSTSSTIKLKLGTAELSSKTIQMTGLVKFTDLSDPNSNTTISGNHITTGTIDASKVSVTNLNANNITSGTISADKIKGGQLIIDSTGSTNAIVVKRNNSNYIVINATDGIKISDGSLTGMSLTGEGFKIGWANALNGIILTGASTGGKITVGSSYNNQTIINNGEVSIAGSFKLNDGTYSASKIFALVSSYPSSILSLTEIKQYSLNNAYLWAVQGYSSPSMHSDGNGGYSFSSNPTWTKISLSQSSYSTKIYGVSTSYGSISVASKTVLAQ